MNAEAIARIVAEYLQDRDDVDSAHVSRSTTGPDESAIIRIVTQGERHYTVSVAPTQNHS